MNVNKIGIPIIHNIYVSTSIDNCIEIFNKNKINYFTRYINNIAFGIALDKHNKI